MSTITIPAPRGLHIPRWLWPLVVVLFTAAPAAWLLVRSHGAPKYVTAPVTQTTLVASVSASGTVNPQNLISVGTQVSGTIASIDVDYNSRVHKGDVLARLDPSTLDAQLAQAQAALAQARAQVSQAVASANGAASGVSVADANSAAEAAAVASAQTNVTKTQAALALAQKTETRDAALLAQGYVAQSTVDTDRSNVAQDQADVASAQAAVAQARAQNLAGTATVGQSAATAASQVASTQAAQANVAAAQAVVTQDELNLQHTVITSPVDGTVVARDVSVGQTVAASLQTPTLFSIAQNLGKMEVDINVGEPDIGNVRPGDAVAFSVLAYPNVLFHGTVAQVRINPQTLNNVVTYDVVVYAENSGGKLLPGMTANATIDVAKAPNALTVPLSALHSTSQSSTGAPTSPWGAVSGSSASAAIGAGSNARLIVLRGGRPVALEVSVRLANGTQAAVVPLQGATLAAGDAVVTGFNGPHRYAGANGQPSRSPMSGSPMSAMRGLH